MTQIFLLMILGMITFILLSLEVIRIYELGYLPHAVKVAVFISDQQTELDRFRVFETLPGKKGFEGKPLRAEALVWGMQLAYYLNFSAPGLGGYFLKCGNASSPSFRFSETVDWSRQMGLKVINFTPRIRSNAYYTAPRLPNGPISFATVWACCWNSLNGKTTKPSILKIEFLCSGNDKVGC